MIVVQVALVTQDEINSVNLNNDDGITDYEEKQLIMQRKLI